MPEFFVTAPDGTKLKITAPEGATEDAALAYAQKNWDSLSKPQVKQYKIGAEGFQDALKSVIADTPTLSKLAVGAKTTIDDYAMRLKQLLGGTLSSEEQQAIEANRTLLKESPAAQAGNIGMNVAATATPAIGAQSAIAPVLQRFIGSAFPTVAKMASPALAAGAVGGAMNAATTPVLPGESAGANAAIGAAGGAAGQAIPQLAARAIQPIVQSPAVQKLTRQGIIPTMGQAANKTARSFEEKLSSLWGVGDVIRWGARRPVDELNLAMMKTVDPSITVIGREGVQAAQDSAERAYQSVASKFTVKPDVKFIREAASIQNNPSVDLTETQRASFHNFVQQVILDPFKRLNAGKVTAQSAIGGRLAKEIDSELGTKSVGYRNSALQSERNLGRAYQDLQGRWRDLMERNAPPGVKEEMAAANKKWANLTILERAAAKSGTEGNGVFTAAQLQQAVREADPSIRKRAFAAGRARMQELSDPAKEILGNKYPDSGTIGRLILAESALGAAGGMLGGASNGRYREGAEIGLGAPLAMAALAAPFYSRPGARFMLGDYAWQKPTADIIRSAAPIAAQLGRSYLRNTDEQ